MVNRKHVVVEAGSDSSAGRGRRRRDASSANREEEGVGSHAPSRTQERKFILEVAELEKDFASSWVSLKTFTRIWNIQVLRSIQRRVILRKLFLQRTYLGMEEKPGKTGNFTTRPLGASFSCAAVSQHTALINLELFSSPAA